MGHRVMRCCSHVSFGVFGVEHNEIISQTKFEPSHGMTQHTLMMVVTMTGLLRHRHEGEVPIQSTRKQLKKASNGLDASENGPSQSLE